MGAATHSSFKNILMSTSTVLKKYASQIMRKYLKILGNGLVLII